MLTYRYDTQNSMSGDLTEFKEELIKAKIFEALYTIYVSQDTQPQCKTALLYTMKKTEINFCT